MEILGIGPLELLFIFLIALVVMGPEDLSKAGRTLGRWLRDLVQSDFWKTFKATSKELKTLPNRLMREANLEDLEKFGKELQGIQRDFGTWNKNGVQLSDIARRLETGGAPPNANAASETAAAPPPAAAATPEDSASDEEKPSA